MLVTSSCARRRAARGFTLIELLVTVAIIAIGLLGVAKLQAAAVAETGVARTRALMTFQAESLAGAMRANEAFWQSSAAYSLNIAIPAGGAISSTALVAPAAATGCVSPASACSPANVAYDDLVTTWGSAFGQNFPTATGTISCNGSATVPVTCDITLQWTEHSVAVNRSTAGGVVSGVAQNTSYMVLHVQP